MKTATEWTKHGRIYYFTTNEKKKTTAVTAMCEQFNSGQQKRCAFIPFLHPNTGRALEHPHFTYLPLPTETTTLPSPSLSKSTALVSRSDKRQHSVSDSSTYSY